jgi:hypothetical protein
MDTQTISAKDKTTIRELAKQYAEIAASDVNTERDRRIRGMHSLKQVRPPLIFGQIPWHELNVDDQLTLRCESKMAQGIENFFRQNLLQWKYFQGDMVAENAYYVYKSWSDSGFGMSVREQTAATDSGNNIISHHYADQLDREDKLDVLTMPVIRAFPEKDKENLEIAADVLDGILPVKLRGHGIYFQPWDIIARLRGITNCLMDMIDNADLIHKTMRKFTDIYIARYDQMEALGLLDYTVPNMNQTPTATDDLPASDYDGGRVRFKDVWWCGTAQLFVSASPAMNDEFNLRYLLPMMKRCGLSYYGCCEPLDNFIRYLRQVPNLRKIGASPWTKLREQAEQMGGDYVLSRKPNPALVAGTINADAVRAEIRETIAVCQETKTPFEYVLKDISTVNYKIANLVEWTRLVTGVIDTYYR